MTTVEALKDLYVAVLNAISAKYSGASDAVLNPDAIDNIAAIAGDIGGGGSGDFSTAQVTVIAGSQNENGGTIEEVVLIDDDKLSVGALDPDNQTTVTALLYKGKQFLHANTNKIESVSGNIEIDETYNCYVITGNCSITMYQAPSE